jgi:pimeloyl-ACP methyl ester carboxylesterase
VLRVIVPSLRGHGDSDRPASGYGMADYAGDIVALMDALGIESARIVGHSMGSLVAQRLAIDHPDRVESLVLIGAFVGLTDNPGGHKLAASIEQLTEPVDPDFVRAFQSSTIARPVSDAFLEIVIGESLKLPLRVWRETVRALLQTDLGPELSRIKAPTLVLWGDKDVFCSRAEQDALLRGVKGARLVRYAGAGHALHWECPEQVAAEIAVRCARR